MLYLTSLTILLSVSGALGFTGLHPLVRDVTWHTNPEYAQMHNAPLKRTTYASTLHSKHFDVFKRQGGPEEIPDQGMKDRPIQPEAASDQIMNQWSPDGTNQNMRPEHAVDQDSLGQMGQQGNSIPNLNQEDTTNELEPDLTAPEQAGDTHGQDLKQLKPDSTNRFLMAQPEAADEEGRDPNQSDQTRKPPDKGKGIMNYLCKREIGEPSGTVSHTDVDIAFESPVSVATPGGGHVEIALRHYHHVSPNGDDEIEIDVINRSECEVSLNSFTPPLRIVSDPPRRFDPNNYIPGL